MRVKPRKIALLPGLAALTVFLVLMTGCVTEGRRTYNTFQSSDNYPELFDAMQRAQNEGRDSTTGEQFAAVRELLYISKYQKDPGKREMAVRGLAFIAYFSDDDDVRDRGLSRLVAILESPPGAVDGYDTYLQVAAVESLRDIVIGRLGYKSGKKKFIKADTGDREDALEYLMDIFPGLPLYIQYRTVGAFDRILDNPPEKNKSLQKRQRRWQGLILGKIPTWFKSNSIPPVIDRALIEMAAKQAGMMDRWAAKKGLPASAAAMVAAVKSRQELYTGGAKPQPVPQSIKSVEGLLGQSNDFIATHLEAALGQQVLSPKTGTSMLVAPGLAFGEYPKSDEGIDRQFIIYGAIVRALGMGMILDEPNLPEKLAGLAGESGGLLRQALALDLAAAAAPSLAASKADPAGLLDSLKEGVVKGPGEAGSRLYLRALVRMRRYFTEAVDARLGELQPKLNVMTRQLVKEWGATLPKRIKPVSRKDFPEALLRWQPPPLEPPPGPERRPL